MNCRIFVLIIGLASISLVYPVEEVRFSPKKINEPATFDDAFEACKRKPSKLLVIEDNYAQKLTERYLNMYPNTSIAFINMKRQMLRETWFLVNGTEFYGSLPDNTWNDYRIYAAVTFDNGWKYLAYRHEVPLPYLCEFYDPNCSNTTDGIRYDGKCLVRFESTPLGWFDARRECISKNGDLAQCNHRTFSFNPNFDTSTLRKTLSYWIGARYRNHNWKVPADSQNETLFFYWSNGKPNDYSYDCVCLDPNGNPRWSWMDCDCNAKRPFLCQIDLEPLIHALERGETLRASVDKKDEKGPNLVLIFGIMIGILLLIFVILVIVCCCIQEKRKKDEAPAETPANTSKKDASAEAPKASKEEGEKSSKNDVSKDRPKGVLKKTSRSKKSLNGKKSGSTGAGKKSSTTPKSSGASGKARTDSKSSKKSSGAAGKGSTDSKSAKKSSGASGKESKTSKPSKKSKPSGASGKKSTTKK